MCSLSLPPSPLRVYPFGISRPMSESLTHRTPGPRGSLPPIDDILPSLSHRTPTVFLRSSSERAHSCAGAGDCQRRSNRPFTCASPRIGVPCDAIHVVLRGRNGIVPVLEPSIPARVSRPSWALQDHRPPRLNT